MIYLNWNIQTIKQVLKILRLSVLCGVRRQCCLLQSMTLILYCASYFLLCGKCRNKPDGIFKWTMPEVRCAHAIMMGSLLHTSVRLLPAVLLRVSRHLQTALTVFCFSIRAAKFSAVCAVERFRMRMRTTAVCAVLELLLELLIMQIFMLCWKCLQIILH